MYRVEVVAVAMVVNHAFGMRVIVIGCVETGITKLLEGVPPIGITAAATPEVDP